MANYGNFQSDNAKYSTSEGRNNHNPEFNPTVNTKGIDKASSFEKNLNKYIDFASWMGWFP